MSNVKLILKLCFFSIIIIVITNCSSTKTFISAVNINEVTIDGLQNEWEGKLNIFGEQKVGVGLRNDDQNLYLCVVVANQTTIARIMRTGLIVRLTPQDGDKEIGIKYPLLAIENFSEMTERMNQPNSELPNLGKRFEQILASQDQIKIVNKDDFPLYSLNANDKNSFQAKIKISKDEFVYELKIPLAANKLSKYIFEAGSKDEISCKIETGTIERNILQNENRQPRQGTGTNIPGGTGRRGGAGAGGMGQGRPGGRDSNFNSSSDKLEIEFMVILN